MAKIWVIAPYDYGKPEIWQRVWENNLRDGFISIGWGELGNLAEFTFQKIYHAHREIWPMEKEKRSHGDAKVLFKFWNEISIGDTVVARRGRKSIAAIGAVSSKPYYSHAKTRKIFHPEREYPNHIDVVWDLEPCDLMFDRQVFGMQTIHTISDANLNTLVSTEQSSSNYFPDEVEEKDFTERGVKKVLVNAYERNAKARAACLKHHGYRCKVCDLLFVEVYGELGINFIHVHHLNPISSKKKSYKVDPKRDLVPVCPNCHAMLHRSKPLLTIPKLRKLILNKTHD